MPLSLHKKDEVQLIELKKMEDARGFFFESYQLSRYQHLGVSFVQDNVSFSKQGTIRGLHYQRTPGQAKLITTLLGTIWDVVVDLRKNSPNFGKWQAFTLDSKKNMQLFIPVGFAHGFCTLSDFALIQYKVSSAYDPEEEKTILWNDPTLNIDWPIQNPLLSLRDETAPSFQEAAQCFGF